jgi:signal transduction histidine kinase
MGKRQEKIINNSGIITGIVLMLIGIFLLLDSLNILNFNSEYILLIIGAIFLLSYFFTKKAGLLIPGVMLLLFSLILIFNLAFLPYLWLLSISLSFFAVYLTKEKDTSWALIPGSILLAITAITVFEFYTSLNALPLILIIIGAYLLFKNYSKVKK